MAHSSDEIVIDCSDCSIQIRKKDTHIDYFDKQAQYWKQIYPAFRLYRSTETTLDFKGLDGNVLTIESGCPISIDGIFYSDFAAIESALNDLISFFFSLICIFDGGTTANRPINPKIYYPYQDTDLGYLVIWDGTNWRNTSGAIA